MHVKSILNELNKSSKPPSDYGGEPTKVDS